MLDPEVNGFPMQATVGLVRLATTGCDPADTESPADGDASTATALGSLRWELPPECGQPAGGISWMVLISSTSMLRKHSRCISSLSSRDNSRRTEPRIYSAAAPSNGWRVCSPSGGRTLFPAATFGSARRRTMIAALAISTKLLRNERAEATCYANGRYFGPGSSQPIKSLMMSHSFLPFSS